jgi:hypothetical protein
VFGNQIEYGNDGEMEGDRHGNGAHRWVEHRYRVHNTAFEMRFTSNVRIDSSRPGISIRVDVAAQNGTSRDFFNFQYSSAYADHLY